MHMHPGEIDSGGKSIHAENWKARYKYYKLSGIRCQHGESFGPTSEYFSTCDLSVYLSFYSFQYLVSLY